MSKKPKLTDEEMGLAELTFEEVKELEDYCIAHQMKRMTARDAWARPIKIATDCDYCPDCIIEKGWNTLKSMVKKNENTIKILSTC